MSAQLFLKQTSAAPAASRFASVVPLPPPSPSSSVSSDGIQSERSLAVKSSDDPHSASDESEGGEEDNDFEADSDSSSSSSAISSALSFSSTTTSGAEDDSPDDDWRLPHVAVDDDEDNPPSSLLLERHRHTSRISYYPRQQQEISMQAIRNADTIGFVALLIPLTGIATMIATETLACTHHFDCASNYPTLSYAATFKPEGHAFMVGMCLTALFILVSSCLFYWFLRLRLKLGGSIADDAQAHYTSLVCLVAGIATAVTLSGLAIMDMRNYHDAHIVFTVLFFISSWVLIVFCHLARRLVLLRERERDVLSSPSRGANGSFSTPGVWLALKRWRRLSVPMAFTLGRLFILAGITSTAMCT